MKKQEVLITVIGGCKDCSVEPDMDSRGSNLLNSEAEKDGEAT